MSNFKKGDKVIILGPARSVGIRHSLLSTGEIIFSEGKDIFYVAGDYPTDPNWWYEAENIQLKSEYDMQNKTEVKRIPFDLERAKKGDKVIDSEDNSCRIICFDRKAYAPIVALHGVDECDAVFHYENGQYYKDSSSEYDLFMAPVEKKAYSIALRNRNDKGIFMATKTSETFDDATKRYAESYSDYFDLISINEISWTE